MSSFRVLWQIRNPMNRYGPISPYDVENLKEKLDSHGLAYEIFVGKEELEAIDQARRARPPSRYPAPHDPGTYLYMDLGDEAFMLVRPDLEKMGVAVPIGKGEVEMVDEYICTECDFVAESPGACPTHRIPLLEFSEWARVQGERARKKSDRFAWFMLLVLGAVVAIAIFRSRFT